MDEDNKPDATIEAAETGSAGQPEAGKTFTQEEVNRIVADRLSREKRRIEAEQASKSNQTKKAPVKDEPPPPDLSEKVEALQKRLEDMGFDNAVAGLELSEEDREDLRELYGTKHFSKLLAAAKATAPAPKPAPKSTPGITPQGPAQADRETGFSGATMDDIRRWREEGTLLTRAEQHRNGMGGSYTFFGRGRKTDK